MAARLGVAAIRGHTFTVGFPDKGLLYSGGETGTGFPGSDFTDVFISPQVEISRKTHAVYNVGPSEQVDVEIDASFIEHVWGVGVQLEVDAASFTGAVEYVPPRSVAPGGIVDVDFDNGQWLVHVESSQTIDPPLFLNSSLGKITLIPS